VAPEGEVAAWAGELERSRSLMRKAWRRHAGNSAAALALASSYMDTGEYVAAQEVLQAALDEDANDADLRYALGETLRRRGETFEAIRMLETLRVRFPHAPRVLIACASSTAMPSAGAKLPTYRRLSGVAAGGRARPASRRAWSSCATRPPWRCRKRPDRAAALDAVVQRRSQLRAGVGEPRRRAHRDRPASTRR
jgi:tetratricopeptide (TPR) repeat protein